MLKTNAWWFTLGACLLVACNRQSTAPPADATANEVAETQGGNVALAVDEAGVDENEKPETLFVGGYDEKEMEAAIEKARSQVDAFIERMAKGDGEQFSVKAAVHDGKNVEHFWLTDLVYRDGVFEGTIGNDPGVVSNVQFGQKWTVKKSEISDWMYVLNDKIHGNYTMRVLLKTAPPEEAAMYRSMLADP
jgi:uncharacterized protein YegJ (DUF2314 family)